MTYLIAVSPIAESLCAEIDK